MSLKGIGRWIKDEAWELTKFFAMGVAASYLITQGWIPKDWITSGLFGMDATTMRSGFVMTGGLLLDQGIGKVEELFS